MKAEWYFDREFPQEYEQAKGEKIVKLPLETLQPMINLIQDELDTNETTATFEIFEFFPKTLRLGSTVETEPLKVDASQSVNTYSTIHLTLNTLETGQMYWSFSVAEYD